MAATLLDPACYQQIRSRLGNLRPDSQPGWGQLTAPRMLVHLGDQIRMTLGDIDVPATPGPMRWPVIKYVVMYWAPWPKGKIQGPREVFVTQPGDWDTDLDTLEALLDRFRAETTRTEWPGHPFFGAMSRKSWGRFSHRHFDHHLRQFGV